MNKLALPVAIIGGQDLGELETTLVRQPSALEQKQRIEALQEKFQGVRSPGELDAATKKEGMPAFLLNFHFATQADLSWMGLGQAMHIPVQIAEREGGRKSIFYLDQNEEVLAGIFVTSEGLLLRHVKRVTGSGSPAQVGDVYSTKITDRDGVLLFEDQMELVKFDPQTGAGQFISLPGTASPRTVGDPRNDLCLFFSALRWP